MQSAATMLMLPCNARHFQNINQKQRYRVEMNQFDIMDLRLSVVNLKIDEWSEMVKFNASYKMI